MYRPYMHNFSGFLGQIAFGRGVSVSGRTRTTIAPPLRFSAPQIDQSEVTERRASELKSETPHHKLVQVNHMSKTG